MTDQTTPTADFTTAPKTQHEIVDQADGETAGMAPGIDERDALETFNRDAIENAAGRVYRNEETGRWYLTFEGESFEARKVDEPTADLENGPSANDDPRYDQAAIAGYDDDLLQRHLDARREQLARARRDMAAAHEQLARLEDPDGRTYIDTLAFLGSYTREHAIQRRIIRQLETEQAKRKIDAAGSEIADGRRLNVELLNDEVAKRGLPCGVDETGETAMAAEMWMQATLALENEGDDFEPTQREVAERVANAYSVLYGYDSVAKHPTRADADAAKADAAALEAKCGTPVGADVTNALAVCILDPRIRIHLDEKALEQARVALGIASSGW